MGRARCHADVIAASDRDNLTRGAKDVAIDRTALLEAKDVVLGRFCATCVAGRTNPKFR